MARGSRYPRNFGSSSAKAQARAAFVASGGGGAPVGALLGAIDGSVLTSAIDGSVLISALA